jgi:hypothetical protein
VKRGFFPLDRQLNLGRGEWSEGVVQEMARLGATQPSYETAVETLGRLTGLDSSDTTVWRRTNETGEAIAAVLEAEGAAVMAAPRVGEPPQAERVSAYQPILDQANASVDGTRILTRESGGREIKLVAVSRVEEVRVTDEQGEREAVQLSDHSYRAKLCELKDFVPELSAETARRRVHRAQQVTSVIDGGAGLEGLILTVLPQATAVLDWPHAMSHIWKAGEAAYGDQAPSAVAWVKARETELWNGQVGAVQAALETLPHQAGEAGEKIRQVTEYVAEHAAGMDYARFRAEGRPIGSGTVESGGRNVIKWRMARGGARWSESRVNPMVALLGEFHSGRYDEAWNRAWAHRQAA